MDTLCAGGAPELISLDLRGNELSDEAQQMLVRHGACEVLYAFSCDMLCYVGGTGCLAMQMCGCMRLLLLTSLHRSHV